MISRLPEFALPATSGTAWSRVTSCSTDGTVPTADPVACISEPLVFGAVYPAVHHREHRRRRSPINSGRPVSVRPASLCLFRADQYQRLSNQFFDHQPCCRQPGLAAGYQCEFKLVWRHDIDNAFSERTGSRSPARFKYGSSSSNTSPTPPHHYRRTGSQTVVPRRAPSGSKPRHHDHRFFVLQVACDPRHDCRCFIFCG